MFCYLSRPLVLLTPTAQPMHWIYNSDRLKEVLSDLEPCPEFRPQSANPFYRRTTGEQTCYGDQAYVLLESLSQCGGCDMDCQIDGVTKLAPVVAMFAGRPEMLEKVESAIRVTQNNDMCVAVTLAAARWGVGRGNDVCSLKQSEILNLGVSVCEIRFLEHFILKGPDPNALDSVLAQLNDLNRKNPQELDRAVIALPGAFQGALHGVLSLNQLDEAVRDTIRRGGCTASRASFIGACFGAQVQ
ncbi:hypothetical protein XENOCAPTIV_017878 [Xenoophorus captivus]|uniref:Uncharacterized protein n=1 Tax=Xenoophorus captivus TaxID=1517983 RepID=A0ABV0R3Z5_9TELE